MSSPEISQVLAQMRVMSGQAGGQANVGATDSTQGASGNFQQLLSNSIDQVNELRQESSALKTAFEQGQDVDLSRVMIASQKSSLAFTAMVEVRNKLVDAYKTVMNMPL